MVAVLRNLAYANSDRANHRAWAAAGLEGSDDFDEILRENEAHIRSRMKARSTRANVVESPLPSGRKRDDASHFVLLAVASLIAIAFGVVMIFSGAAVESGFPLSYAAATLVAIGLFVGALAEWRNKRAKM